MPVETSWSDYAAAPVTAAVAPEVKTEAVPTRPAFEAAPVVQDAVASPAPEGPGG